MIRLVVEMYQRAIEFAEVSEAYKNLGLFHWERDGDPAKIISLWETYLELKPDDPQAGEIRRRLDQLRAGG